MDKFLIGKIIKPQGIKGECKVQMFSNDADDFANLNTVFLDDKKYDVIGCDVRFGFAYITLAGVKDRNQAELLRNKKLYIDKSEVDLDYNEFIIGDIIGFDVVDESGEHIGKLQEIEQFGAADVFVVWADSREYRIPYISSIVLDVNTTLKEVVVNRERYDEVKLCD